jgi:NADPH-dependent curcumin reductase CurA
VLPLLNTHARVPLCGLISQYNEPAPAEGAAGDRDSTAKLMRAILVKRITLRGFIIFDFASHHEEFVTTMSGWLRAGRIKYREDIVQGIEHAPEAFLGLLAGRNFGKLVVRVSPAEARA